MTIKWPTVKDVMTGTADPIGRTWTTPADRSGEVATRVLNAPLGDLNQVLENEGLSEEEAYDSIEAHVLVLALAYELSQSKKDPNITALFDVQARYLIDNLPDYLVVTWSRVVLSLFRINFDPSKSTLWDEFSSKYQNEILLPL